MPVTRFPESRGGTAGEGGGLRLEQVLRARFLELKMRPGKAREVPNRLRQNETCDLCALEGNWFHVCSMCKHPDMRDFYTVRHNSVGRTLLHAMRQGKLGRWLTLTSFGRVDDQGEQQTIPDWMLPPTAKAALRRERSAAGMEEEAAGGGEPPTEGARPGGPPAEGAQPRRPPAGGIQPDIVVLEGWPETVDPPGGPVTHWTSPEGARRAVRVRIGELASRVTF